MRLIASTRAQANEQDVLWLPREWYPSRQATTNPYGVVFCHGNGDSAVSPQDILSKPGQFRLVEACVEAGFPVVSMDMGRVGVTANDLNGWGNAVTVARVAAGRTFLTTATIGAKAGKVILLAVSAGAVAALNYAKDTPGNVAGLFGAVPVCDLDDIYQANRANLRAGIGTAHGVTYPTALPAGVNPATSQGSLSSVPVRLSYSSADTIVIGSTVTTLATAIGATALLHSTTLNHSEDSILAIDRAAMVAWMGTLT